MTPQQWQTWTQITGEPFSFPQTAFFPHEDDDVSVAQRPVVPTGTPSNQFVPKSVPQDPVVPNNRPQNNTVR
jgi:hypothetical protein